MTREEAISIMKVIVHMLEEKYDTDRVEEAVDMAIKALEQEPCEDAISRQAVLDIIEDRIKNGLPQNVAISQYYHMEVEKLPPVKPQESKMGHWIRHTDASGNSWHTCPACGHVAYTLSRFCPDCGARLEAPS